MNKNQSVSYSQKFRGKRTFPSLANIRTSQFMFPKYLIKYQNVKKNSEIKFKEKNPKNNAVLKEKETKRQ